jgi:signal transduction histidine kinase/phage shock protein PspC (stress-responsive transcriptional regulator)
VAVGLARRFGVDPVIVRIAFVVLSFAGGTGLLLYGALWVLFPTEPPLGENGGRQPSSPRSRSSIQQSVALGLIVLGVLLLLRRLGLWFGDGLVFPILLASLGSAVVWTRSDSDERDRLRRRIHLPGGRVLSQAASGPASPVRLIVGTLLVAGAVAGFLAANDALVAVRELGVAGLAAAVGVSMLFGPWLWRLGEQLNTERRERIRQEERAELAAHLHDSVLQTLALIQRSPDQPRRMVALARRQERELRAWLFDGSGSTPGDALLSGALAAVAEEIEATHDATVEVVLVGDSAMDDPLRALVGATREAAVNASKHAGVDRIDIYVEVEEREVLAFVRDRGRGFSPAEVPADRHGIRRSIVDRLDRHGGRANIHSAPGEGTEVELALPLRRADTASHNDDARAPDDPDDPRAPHATDNPEATA